MKNNIAIIFMLICLSASAQKNIYESEKFDELSRNHDNLAIIPFLTNLELKDQISNEELKDLEKKEGYAVQDALETYFGQFWGRTLFRRIRKRDRLRLRLRRKDPLERIPPI